MGLFGTVFCLLGTSPLKDMWVGVVWFETNYGNTLRDFDHWQLEVTLNNTYTINWYISARFYRDQILLIYKNKFYLWPLNTMSICCCCCCCCRLWCFLFVEDFHLYLVSRTWLWGFFVCCGKVAYNYVFIFLFVCTQWIRWSMTKELQ